jgi:hypothetical protein
MDVAAAVKQSGATTRQPFTMDAVEPEIWQKESAHREAMQNVERALLNGFPQFDSKLVMVTVVREWSLLALFLYVSGEFFLFVILNAFMQIAGERGVLRASLELDCLCETVQHPFHREFSFRSNLETRKKRKRSSRFALHTPQVGALDDKIMERCKDAGVPAVQLQVHIRFPVCVSLNYSIRRV